MASDQATKLQGAELLAKLKTMGNVGKSQKAHACGYYSYKKDGSIRYNYTQLYQAIAEANGVDLKPKKTGKRSLAYRAAVLTTGAVLIGARYVQELGLQAGDQVAISRRGGKLVLDPIKV